MNLDSQELVYFDLIGPIKSTEFIGNMMCHSTFHGDPAKMYSMHKVDHYRKNCVMTKMDRDPLRSTKVINVMYAV